MALWRAGGWYGGGLPNSSASSAVYSSPDGANWELATAAAPWAAREAAAGVVFQGRLLVLGGVREYFTNTEGDLLNDVWASSDGKEWECLTPRAPWAGRAYHQVAASTSRGTQHCHAFNHAPCVAEPHDCLGMDCG